MDMERLMVSFNVSTHSRAEAAAVATNTGNRSVAVSTHSRAEAAAANLVKASRRVSCFNTQPRGGGCSLHKKVRKISELNTVFR